jgi:SAM-dependent methyltransferase
LSSQWFETFFRDVVVDVWVAAMPPEITAAETAFLERHLAVPHGASLLDVPCGAGRHSIAFAQRGYRVTGVDISADFLERARKLADEAHVEVEWVRSDMRQLSREREFDGAWCFGNSFGYLDRDGAAVFLESVRRALRPGGRFVADIPTAAESILLELGKHTWHRAGDIYMGSESRYVPAESRVDIDYTFFWEGKVETRHTASYVFTCRELVSMFEAAGFQVVDLFGSTGDEPYALGSPQLFVVAERA